MIFSKIKQLRDPANLLFLLVFFPILPFGISSITLMLFVFLSLVFNYKNIKENYNRGAFKPFITHTLFFIILVCSLFYTTNFNKGVEEIKRILPLFILPFILFFCYKDQIKKNIPVILNLFVFANFLYIIYLYNFIVFKLSPYKEFGFRHEIYPIKFIKSFFIPFNKILLKAIHVDYQPPYLIFHKAYMSMFVLFSIFILVHQFTKTNKKVIKLIYTLLIMLFLIVIFHWFSMPNIFVLGLVSFLGIIKALKLLKYKIIFISILLACSFFFLKIPVVKNVINTNAIVNTNYKQLYQFVKGSFSDSNTNLVGRAAINYCNVKLIKEKPLTGYGVGAANSNLLKCYEEKDYKAEFNGKLNSHNYYFHIYLSAGLLALTAFLFLIIDSVIMSISRTSLLYLSFLIIIIVNMGFENILFRSHGILFFSIFNSLLYLFVKKENLNYYKWK